VHVVSLVVLVFAVGLLLANYYLFYWALVIFTGPIEYVAGEGMPWDARLFLQSSEINSIRGLVRCQVSTFDISEALPDSFNNLLKPFILKYPHFKPST
jgi:hypothetical protein